MKSFRARFDGKVFVPEEAVDLPVGKSLMVRVLEDQEPDPHGSPEALRALLQRPPRVSIEDVDALEKSIEEGKLPPK